MEKRWAEKKKLVDRLWLLEDQVSRIAESLQAHINQFN
jgi:hypothetical protein